MIYDKRITQIEQCYSTDEKGRVSWFHNNLGSYLINKLNIFSKDDRVYLYKNGIYVSNEMDILREIQVSCKIAKESFRREVLKFVEIAAPIIEIDDNYNLICCKNGVYDIKNDLLVKFDKSMFLRHKINAIYDANAKCDAVDQLLDKISCNDKKIRLLIEEVIGYCLYRNCRYQKCFLLSGFGKNGKSTLLEMINNFIGGENISALSLTDLQDKFKKAELRDKLVNINDDQGNVCITNTEDFKSIVTGGILTMERKNQHPFKYQNYTKLIMSANEIPKSKDKSEGYYRRFIIIPLNAKIKKTDKDFDPNISDKVITPEATSYILNLAISGIKRVIKNGGFSENESTDDEMKEYKEDNDPIIKYVNETGLEKIVGETTDSVFCDFNLWFEREYNRKARYNKTTITRSLKNNFEIETKPQRIDGQLKRVYRSLKEEENVTQRTVLQISMCNSIVESAEKDNGDLPY